MFRESPIIRWRNYSDRYKLTGHKCAKCSRTYFEKKGMCECGSLEFQETLFSGKGKIIAFTQIHAAPEAYKDKAPYCVGIIELEEGARIESQIVDCKYEELKYGLEVEAVFRKLYTSGETGIIHYGTKFVPKY